METHNFHERTLHLGYYLIGAAVLQITRPLGIPTDTALIALSAILMTVALALSWKLFRALGEDDRTGHWALFVLLFAGVFLQMSTEAEVYPPQLVFSLLAYLSYLRDRPVWAGFFLGLATLVTPLGVLAVGFFVAEAIRTREWKRFVIMGVVGSLTFLPVLALVWRDYFFGTRGLMSDPRVVQTSAKGIDNAIALVRNFHFLLPFLVAGLVIAWREQRRWIWLLLGLGIFHILAVLTVTENGVFLLPMYPILAAIIALGVVAGLDAKGTLRTATVLALVLYVGASLLIWLDPYDQRVRDGMLEGIRRVPPGSTVVTNWSFAETLEFYAGAPRDTVIESRHLLWPERMPDIVVALHSGQPVYLMESHFTTPGVRWLYPRAMQERHYEESALMPRMRRALGVTATPFFSRPGGPIFYRLSLP